MRTERPSDKLPGAKRRPASLGVGGRLACVVGQGNSSAVGAARCPKQNGKDHLTKDIPCSRSIAATSRLNHGCTCEYMKSRTSCNASTPRAGLPIRLHGADLLQGLPGKNVTIRFPHGPCGLPSCTQMVYTRGEKTH